MLQTVLSKKVLKILEQILLEGKILLRVYFRDIKDGIFWSTEAALQTCFREKVFWKYAENYRRTPTPKCDFNEVALQLYWNQISVKVFSCKFAAYFRSTFSKEHF